MLPQNLGPVDVRVLGALIEKELSTPDHYPLSLNAMVSACNQSSNRDPVLTLDDRTVSGGIDVLRRLSLVRSFQGSGERVPKYQHLLADGEGLSRAERAVLAVLMLRGPQTLADVRSRAVRLAPDESAEGIQDAVESLARREPPAVERLARQPGQKEARYAHLLGGAVVDEDGEGIGSSQDGMDGSFGPAGASSSLMAPATDVLQGRDRIAALEALTGELRREVADLRSEFAEFRRQFE